MCPCWSAGVSQTYFFLLFSLLRKKGIQSADESPECMLNANQMMGRSFVFFHLELLELRNSKPLNVPHTRRPIAHVARFPPMSLLGISTCQEPVDGGGRTRWGPVGPVGPERARRKPLRKHLRAVRGLSQQQAWFMGFFWTQRRHKQQRISSNQTMSYYFILCHIIILWQ